MKNKIELIRDKVEKRIPRIFQKRLLQQALESIHPEIQFSDSTQYKIENQAQNINVHWTGMPQISLLSFHKDYELIEVVAGLCTGQAKYCVSHYSALYWNELVEQRPTNYYLSKEAPNRKSTHTKEYDFDLIKQTFMKSPRHTIYCLDHEKNKIFLLEKVNLGQIGVIEKTVKVHDRKATFKLTNIERTLIDAVMAPQYSGGILTVIHAFESAKINLRDLVEVYNKYNPFYPYWQSIGLILEQTKGEKLAADWATNFGKIENKFFLDHQYKSNWNYSEKWKIYYPTGIFSSDN